MKKTPCLFLVSGSFGYFSKSLRPLGVAVVLMVAQFQYSFGQAIFNSNAATGNWNSAGSWTLISGTDANGIPDSDDDVTILDNHNITVNVASAANSVTISSLGTITASNTLTVTTSMSVDGSYIHNINGGTIPTATWNPGSTCTIQGMGNSTSPPAGLNQAFDSFTWNSAGQTKDVDLAGALQTVNGNLTISSTGSKSVMLTSSVVAGLTVGGNMIMNGGTFDLSGGSSAGTIHLTGSNGAGDLTLTGGTITETGSSSGTISFEGTNQTFSSSGTISKNINYVVGAGSATVLVLSGESVLDGLGTLTVNDQAKLYVQSTNATGAIVSGTNGGNIRNSGTRTYNSGATIVYGGPGVAGAQFIGSGHPTTGSGVTTEIDNSLGVTNSGAIIIPGDLTLTDGTLSFTSSSVTLNGNISVGSGAFAISGASWTINGTGALGTGNFPFSGSPSIVDFTLNRTLSGSVTFGTSVAVTGNMTLTNGNLIFTQPLSLAGNYTTTNGKLSASGSASLTLTGNTALTSQLDFVSGSTLSSFTLNKSNNGTSATISSTTLNITNSLTITDGDLSLSSASSVSLGSGATIATITRTGAGSIITNSPVSGATSGTWNVTYSGATVGSTTKELPTSGNINNLTVNVSSANSVTLSQVLIVNGAFSIPSSGRTFTCGANNVTVVGSFSNAGTFSAPTGTLTLNGTFSNTGTFTHNSGTVAINNSAVSFSGTVPTFGSFTVNAGVTFTAPSTLTIQGNLTNNGTSFNAGTGTVTFSGNNAKQILGSTKIVFNNINLVGGTNAADLTLATTAGADLSGKLTLSGSNPNQATFSTGGNTFRLLSTGDKPTVDASIAALPAGNSVTGNVTVQRVMQRIGDATTGNPPYPYQVWRNISSPVTSLSVAQLQQSIPITGSTLSSPSSIPGADATVASMYTYNEAITAGNLDNGWTVFPVSSDAETLTPGKGYSVFIFGADSYNQGTNTLLSMTGTINSFSISLPVTFNSSGTIANDGWNLVGNPYPSSIDWNASSGWTKTNIGSTIYMEDYNTGSHGGTSQSRFASCNNGLWTNGGTNGSGTSGGPCYIPTAQGFWVKASAASPVLTATENVKATGSTTEFFRQAAPSNVIRATLISGNNMRDETVIYFSDLASADFDSEYDGLKMPNRYGYINLSSLSNNDKYAINGMSFSDCSKTVGLDVSDVVSGTYSLEFSQFESMPTAMNISLRDNFTNSTINVRQNQTYSFSVDENNTSTFGSNRFSLLFNYSAAAPTITSQSADVCDPSLAVVTVKNTSTDFNYSLLSTTDGSVISASTIGTGSDLVFSLPLDKVTAGTNQYQIKEVNKFCSTISAASNVSLLYAAVPQAPVGTAAQSCGPGTVTLSASGAPSNGHYAWYETQDSANPYPVQISTFTTENISKDKTYYVASVNSLGCEGPRTAVTAKVVTLAQPTITVVDLNTLQSDYDAGIQWYLNDQPIAGATNKTLHVTQSGVYKLSFTNQGCTISTEKQFAVTGVENLPEGIQVYPNPVSSKGGVTIEVAGSDEAFGTLLNALGVSVNSIRFTSGGVKQVATHDFTTESSGIYFVKISQGNKVTVVRIVKE